MSNYTLGLQGSLQKLHKNQLWNNVGLKYLEETHVATTGGTIPFFSKVFKYIQIFGGFCMLRQIIPSFLT